MGTFYSTFGEQTLAEQLNMKLLILISLIACGNAAKLDKTYLPPASASSAGGSPGSLLAPGSDRATLDSSSDIGRQSVGESEIQTPSFAPELTKPSSEQLSQNGFQSGSLPIPGFRQPSGSSEYGQPSKSAGYGSGFVNQLSNSGAEFGLSTGVGFESSDLKANVGQPNFLGSPQNGYKQSSSLEQEQGSNNIQAYNIPQGAQAATEEGAQILKYDIQNDEETFSYSFETSNGIRAEESGIATNGVRAKGGFGYTGEDGQDYSITYTADENGYQPQGEHLPTPYPIPEEILKSIEKNARAAAAGTQEGAYRPEEYKNEGSSETYNTESFFNEEAKGSSQLYESPQYGPGSNQGAQGYNQESQANNAFDQNQNQGIKVGQSISAVSDNQEPQGQSSFGQGTRGNEGYGYPTIGKNVESNQGTSQFTSGQVGAKQDYNRQDSQGQSNIKQGDSDQGQSFSGTEGEGQSGYEYNRPQGSGQLESPSLDQSSSQGSSSSFSRPSTGSIEGYFGANVQGLKNTYITPSKTGQDSEYQSGQYTFGSGPSGSSSIGRAPTGSQSDSFTPTIQGPNNTYITPNQPGQDSEYRPGQSTFGSRPSGTSTIGQLPTSFQGGPSMLTFQGPKNTYITPNQPGQDTEYQPDQSTFGSRPSGSTSIGQTPTSPQERPFLPTIQSPKNTYIIPNQPGQNSEYQPSQSTFGSSPSGSSSIGQTPTSPQDKPFGPTIQGPKNTYITPNQPGQDSEYQPGQSTFGSRPPGSSSIGQTPTSPQDKPFGPTIQGPKNTYITPNQPGQDSEYQPGQSTFGSRPPGSSPIGQTPTSLQNGYCEPTFQGPKNTYITPSQSGQDSEYRPGQSLLSSGTSGSSSVGHVPAGPQNQYIPPSGQSESFVNQVTPTFGGPRQPPSFDAQEGYKY